jgi:aminopeptidase N
LLKMLREFIGEEAFKKGLRSYFEKHAYQNATREDLWQALSEASGQDISKLMTPWLVQSGLPVLHVKKDKRSLNITQERFMLDAKADSSHWPVPLLADPPLTPAVLTAKQQTIAVKASDYPLINQFGSGHYLVHYEPSDYYQHFIQGLQKRLIATEARINLFNDAYLLARHGDASLVDALTIMEHCTSEDRDAVWSGMLRLVGAASQLTEGDQLAEDLLKKVRVSLAKDWYNKLGWDDTAKDDPNTKQLRHTMVALMIGGEDSEVIKEALKRYKQAKDLSSIQAELRGIILIAAVKHGNTAVVNHLMKQYSKVGPDVQLDITSALSATKDSAVAESILKQALGPKGFVRDQDTMRWLVMFLRNHHTRQVAWDYLLKNWDWFEETFQNSKSFDYLPTYAASMVTTDEWAKKYHALFDSKRHIKILERNIKLGIADINARVAWRKRDENKIKAWLGTFVKSTPAK